MFHGEPGRYGAERGRVKNTLEIFSGCADTECMSDTTTITTDPRDLRPTGRRVSDPEQIRAEISALEYGRLCALLADAQAQLARKTASGASRFDWARADGYAEGLAVACSALSGIPAHELRQRLAPVAAERRAR